MLFRLRRQQLATSLFNRPPQQPISNIKLFSLSFQSFQLSNCQKLPDDAVVSALGRRSQDNVLNSKGDFAPIGRFHHQIHLQTCIHALLPPLPPQIQSLSGSCHFFSCPMWSLLHTLSCATRPDWEACRPRCRD